jgi:hypothetical protein
MPKVYLKHVPNHPTFVPKTYASMCQKGLHDMPQACTETTNVYTSNNMQMHTLRMFQNTKIQTSKAHRKPYLSTCEKPGAYHHKSSHLLHLQQQEFIKLYLILVGLVFGLVKNFNFQQE